MAISGQARVAAAYIGMSRFELFNGRTQKAECKPAAQSRKKLLNDIALTGICMSNQIKSPCVEGDRYIRINSSITVAEDYLLRGRK